MSKHSEDLGRRQVNKGDNKGSITVFLTVILLSVILFTGSMVDVSRMMVADNKVDSAIRAATKSLMADYDKNLIGAYGLFGNNIGENQEDFKKYMKENLEMSSTGFIKYELVEDSVAVSNGGLGLDNLDVFQQQIDDYMKVKTPINIAESVVTRFLKLMQGLKSADNMLKEDNFKVDEEVFNGDYDDGDSIKDMKKTDENLQNGIDQINKDKERANAVAASTGGILAEVTGESVAGAQKDDSDKVLKILSEMKEINGEIINLQEKINEESQKEEPDGDLIDEWEEQKERCKERYKEKAKEGEAYYDDDSKKAEEANNEREYNKLSDQFKAQREISDAFKAYLANNPSGERREKENKPDGRKDALKWLSELGKALGNHMNNIEYAKDRFTYATIENGRKLSEQNFKNSEIEYIIIGSTNAYDNIVAVGAEILAICYACHVVDCLMAGMPISPLLFITAGVFSAADMVSIYKGESVFLLPMRFPSVLENENLKKAVSLSYLDFLDIIMRIDYLIIGPDNFLRRMQNLIGFNCLHADNPEARLSDMKTEVQTVASVDMNLIFLPMLPLESLGINGFRDSKYRITKTYEFSYQYIE